MQNGTTDRRSPLHPPQCTTSLSARTIRRHLQQSGLSARRPLLGLTSTQNHRRLHRQWCDERKMWAVECNEVVFTDESRICLQHHDGRFRVWRHRGERMMNSCVMHRHTGPAPGIMFGLAIHQNDHQARRRFVEWAQNEIAVVPNFHKRILFSDEAHFWLNGYVNKQNCRIWSEANPQVYVETPLHPEKLTELWFQQDGATCHTARATIDLLKDTFGDRLISHFGPVNWPPRSCDLTPLDYFLWSYVKSLVYADKPQTLDHLEDNIRRVIADIRPQMLEKVIENWTSRLDYIRASRGSPLPEIIFKM
ncbi:DUF4817 domain-containing protein [Trichonephila clavipes]|nr:DUF4817 domain-containing protein [Trichonephila clavipes]